MTCIYSKVCGRNPDCPKDKGDGKGDDETGDYSCLMHKERIKMTIPMIIERMLMMQNDINRLRLRIEKLEKESPKNEC